MSIEFSRQPAESIILSRVRRPSRYMGGEWNQIIKAQPEVKLVLAFPDAYEIGMSNLGLQILYEIINAYPEFACERVFAPWPDMEEQMRRENIPLWALESKRPLIDFDLIGFSLQYELNFTNVLNMIDLAGLPLAAEKRNEHHPLIIAGGPCSVNPEPMAHFIDAFVIGEAEEAIVQLLRIVRETKAKGHLRPRVLNDLSWVEGIYVPALYRRDDGKPLKIKKRTICHFDKLPPPKAPITPFLETVHDRCVIEIMRGCTRGCRFCQAGVIYRPTRERSAAATAKAATDQLRTTGREEMSLSSLSSSDHSEILPMLEAVKSLSGSPGRRVSLPSLRTDRFSVELAKGLAGLKRAGLTFAPEAGTSRLRKVINKGLTEEDIIETCLRAFKAGWRRLKLYFMIGLPTETDEDVIAIAETAKSILAAAHREMGGKPAKRLKLTVSVSSFVPKAHSPFQWAASLAPEEVERKQQLLRDNLKTRRIDLKWHDARAGRIEAALARGGREMGMVIAKAFEFGARFDGWTDTFDYELWLRAFAATGIEINTVANRARGLDEVLPWDHIDVGVTKKWLKLEYNKALNAQETIDCRRGVCSRCGACKGEIGLEIIKGPASGDGNLAKEGTADAGHRLSISSRQSREKIIVRLKFSKTPEVRWLSHLELGRALARAFRRAEVPVKYSEGFSPHPKIALSPALPVGVSGFAEYVDVVLVQEVDTIVLVTDLNAILPSGLEAMEAKVLPAGIPSLGASVKAADYLITIGQAVSETALRELWADYVEQAALREHVYTVLQEVVAFKGINKVCCRLPIERKLSKLVEVFSNGLEIAGDRLVVDRVAQWMIVNDRLTDPMRVV